MKRNVITVLGAIAVLFSAGAVTASAQTAGGSVLEQVSYLLKDSYKFGLNSQGSCLTLRNSMTGVDGLVLESNKGSVLFHIYLGNLSTLSAAKRERAEEKITSMNTMLPIGTLVVAEDGDVLLTHHVGQGYVEATGIAKLVGNFVIEATRQKSAIFG